MNYKNSLFRLATSADSKGILDIYAPYVEKTAISFEIETPGVSEFSKRIENILIQFPYVVYEDNGRIAGFAYASKYRERAAYCYGAELSIYISPDYKGRGIAKKLYGFLFKILKEQNYCNLYAGITFPNEKSIGFHLSLGFTQIGTFHKTGYKLNKWHDVIWFEKNINDYSENQLPIKTINELPAAFLEKLFLEDSHSN